MSCASSFRQQQVENLIRRWEDAGQWKTPNVVDAMLFVLTEVGEVFRAMAKSGYLEDTPEDLTRVILGVADLVEAYLRKDGEFVRNNDYDGYKYHDIDAKDLAIMFDAYIPPSVKDGDKYVDEEVADVYFMLLVASIAGRFNLEKNLIGKLLQMNTKKTGGKK